VWKRHERNDTETSFYIRPCIQVRKSISFMFRFFCISRCCIKYRIELRFCCTNNSRM
jgi:hypothetical protein